MLLQLLTAALLIMHGAWRQQTAGVVTSGLLNVL